MITTRRVFFLMVDHPLRGKIRVGPAYSDRESAASWRPFVRRAWHGCRTTISTCTLRWIDGSMDASSVALLDQKYNMSAPDGGS
jgi:hypothetical protein